MAKLEETNESRLWMKEKMFHLRNVLVNRNDGYRLLVQCWQAFLTFDYFQSYDAFLKSLGISLENSCLKGEANALRPDGQFVKSPIIMDLLRVDRYVFHIWVFQVLFSVQYMKSNTTTAAPGGPS